MKIAIIVLLCCTALAASAPACKTYGGDCDTKAAGGQAATKGSETGGAAGKQLQH